jgi:aspartate carbamoyltransferase catalytic subunit
VTRLLLSIDDLVDDAVASVLHRAAEHRAGTAHLSGTAQAESSHRPIVGLVFLEASLRTRVGFTSAAFRLGWQTVDVQDLRASPTSATEDWRDTLRTVSGYVDLLVARLNRPLLRAELTNVATVPLVNGGDTGVRAEHPSQALIDVFTMSQEAGPIEGLRIAICGDLRMRTARSLLALLARRPPARLALITLDSLRGPDPVPPSLRPLAEYRPPWQLDDIDVLYVAGTPHGVVGEDDRSRLRVDQRALADLPGRSVVLSPMPVIDEIAYNVRDDARLRMFQQSDGGVFVRMALLEHLLSSNTY